MFGLKMFNKTKSEKFASDKERKRYFAIQNYYKEKAEQEKSIKPVQKKKNDNKKV